ncbi:MAG: hypothetical protein KatS3mg058_3181 [Roseiflexus sp.]|nr:MAG: hypothetical protein KatS3mg058_3181 [Roseiflexus sp.]
MTSRQQATTKVTKGHKGHALHFIPLRALRVTTKVTKGHEGHALHFIPLRALRITTKVTKEHEGHALHFIPLRALRALGGSACSHEGRQGTRRQCASLLLFPFVRFGSLVVKSFCSGLNICLLIVRSLARDLCCLFDGSRQVIARAQSHYLSKALCRLPASSLQTAPTHSKATSMTRLPLYSCHVISNSGHRILILCPGRSNRLDNRSRLG